MLHREDDQFTSKVKNKTIFPFTSPKRKLFFYSDSVIILSETI